MAWTHVSHRVEDYPKWKEVFDSTAEYKRSRTPLNRETRTKLIGCR
jgi:hypothetical protein